MSEGNGYVTRDSLFSNAAPRRFKDVEIDGKKFRLRSLVASESNKWAVKSQTPKGLITAGPRLIVLCVVNSDGQTILSDLDVAGLLEMDAEFINKLSNACQEHSGVVLNTDLEDIEKN